MTQTQHSLIRTVIRFRAAAGLAIIAMIAAAAPVTVLATRARAAAPVAPVAPAQTAATPAALPAVQPSADDARAALDQALRAIDDSSEYRFAATVEQTLNPRPLPGQLGAQTQRVTLLLDGERGAAESRFTVRVADDPSRAPASFVSRDGRLFVQREGELQPVQGQSDAALLPATRMADFLSAADNVRVLPATADTGVRRYAFGLNMRALSARLANDPRRAALPDAFARVQGAGEVWIDAASGLIRRQIVTLDIPSASAGYDAQVRATVDLSDWRGVSAPTAPATAPAAPVAPRAGVTGGTSTSTAAPSMAAWLAVLLTAVAGLAVIAYRHAPGRAQRLITQLLVALLLGSAPLSAAGNAVAAEQQRVLPTINQALGLEAPANTTTQLPSLAPAADAPSAAEMALGHPAPARQSAQQPAAACGDGVAGADTDQDGLTDQQELCLGTDPLNADTDEDGLSDRTEVLGFSFSGRIVNTSPFEADSNRDRLSDSQELTATLDGLASVPVAANEYDIDGDGQPNIDDIDNDGDGVPDGVDLSPFENGAYGPDVTFELSGGAPGEYQYIEGQVQPQSAAERVFATTPLDWPDGDSLGQITDLDRSKDDLRLAPFLRVETRNVPESLLDEYGIAMWQRAAAGEDSVMLLPLTPVVDGGLVKGFYFKAAYTPDEAAIGVRWKARVVWVLRGELDTWIDGCYASGANTCVRRTTQLLHTYDGGAFRVTGLNAVKSRGYELLLLGTPQTPNEDGNLFHAIFSFSHLFFHYATLEDQPATRSALAELADRFSPGATGVPARLRLNLPITLTVAVSRTLYAHHDEAIAESNLSLTPRFLNAHYGSAPDAQRCLNPDGTRFQCAAIGMAYEEKLGTLPWATAANGRTLSLNLASVPLVTSRGLRAGMYERTLTGWQAMGSARLLSTIENRYSAQMQTLLGRIRQTDADATENDVRMAAYLPYLEWVSGNNVIAMIDGVNALAPQVDNEGQTITQNVPTAGESTSATLAEKMIRLRPVWSTPAGQSILSIAGAAALGGLYRYRSTIKTKLVNYVRGDAFKASIAWKATGKLVQAGTVAVAIAATVCAHQEPGACDEQGLYIAQRTFMAVDALGAMAGVRGAYNAYRVVAAQRAGYAAAASVITGSKATMPLTKSISKGGAALAAIGSAVDITMAWVQFSMTTSNLAADDDIGHKRALALAIGTTIWAVIVVLIAFIPVVGSLIVALLGMIDAIITAVTGGSWNLARVMVELFYSVNVLTEIKSSSFTGGQSSLADPARGFVSGNRFRINDHYHGMAVPTSDGGPGDLNDARFRGFYVIAGQAQLRAPAAVRESGHTCYYVEGTRSGLRFDGWQWHCENDLQVEYQLPDVATRDYALSFHMQSRIGIVYEECGLFGAICGSNQVDYRTLPEDGDLGEPSTVHVDVLPASAAALWSPAQNGNLIGNPDRDGDGLPNEQEVALGANPDNADSDGDGLSDGYEAIPGTRTATSPIAADTDGDGLNDYAEALRGLSPINPDVDADGLRDGEEIIGWPVALPGGITVTLGSDPKLLSADGDELNDAQERAAGQSAHAANVGPRMVIDIAPFDVSPNGERFGAVVRPSTAVTAAFALVNAGPDALSNNAALALCLPPALSGVAAATLTGDRTPQLNTAACAIGGQQAAWHFDGANTLQVFEAVSGIVRSAASSASASARGDATLSVPYGGRVYTDSAPVIVDADVPDVRLSAPADGAILRRDPAGTLYNVGGVTGDASSWVRSVTLNVNYAPAATLSNPEATFVHGWSLPLTDGQYTLVAAAVDHVGNAASSAPVRVTVDGTAPSAAVDLTPFNTVNGRSFVRSERGGVIVLGGTASDATAGLASVQISIDGKPYREVLRASDIITAPALLNGSWSFTWTLPITGSTPDGQYPAQGAHSIVLRAVDRAGNIADMTPVTLVVDLAPPSDDLTTNTYFFTPTVRAGVPISLSGRANELGNLPLPSHAARLEGALDAVYSATLWLQMDTLQDASAGLSMTWLGDINGDGRNDLAVGAPGSNRVAVIYGRTGDFRVPPDAEALFNSPSVFAGDDGAAIGGLLAPLGDVNGDGLYDFAIGDAANQRAFVVFGKPGPLGSGVRLSDGQSGTRLDLSGLGALREIRGAGDVDNDGRDDMLVTTTSAVYLLLGREGNWPADLALDAQAAAIVTVANASAAGLGDLDGDGYADFGVAASNSVRVLRGGTGYVARARSALSLGSAWASFASAQAAPRLLPLGDMNGDGKADFAFANGASARLVLGGITPAAYSGALPSANGFVAAPGDVNADGKADLLLGNSASSTAYLVHGSASITAGSSAPLVAIATFNGVSDAASAPYASGADLNCDQAADLLLLPAAARAPSLTHTETSAYARADNAAPQLLPFDSARLPAASTAYSATWPMPGANVLYVGCPGCYATIQAAVDAAAANSRIVVLPGVYAPFLISGIARNGLSIEGAGAGADQVIIDAAGGANAVELRDVKGITLSRLHLRNARVGVRVTNSGSPTLGAASVSTSTVQLNSLLVQGVLSSTLDLDRLSYVAVRNSTLLDVASQPVVTIGSTPDPAYTPAWASRSAITNRPSGSLVTADDGSAQPPIYALQGDRGLQRYDPASDTWTARANVPVTITTGSSNLASNSNGSQLFVLPSQTWNGLGRGVNGPVRAITRHGNCIIVAGSFTTMYNPDGSSVASNGNYGLGCFDLSTNTWRAITLYANNASTIQALAVGGSPSALLVGGQLRYNGSAYGFEKCSLSGSVYSCAMDMPSNWSPFLLTEVHDIMVDTTDPTVMDVHGTFTQGALLGCTGSNEGTQGGLWWDLGRDLGGAPGATCAPHTRADGSTYDYHYVWVTPDEATWLPGHLVYGCYGDISCQNPPRITFGAKRGAANASINTILLIDGNNFIAGGDFTSVDAPVLQGNGYSFVQTVSADAAFQCGVAMQANGFKGSNCWAITIPGTAGTAVTVMARGSGSGNIYAARGGTISRRNGDGSWTQITTVAATTITSLDDIMVNGLPQLIVGGTFGGSEALPASPNVALNYASFYTYTAANNTWSTTPFPTVLGSKTLLSHNGTNLDIFVEGSSAMYQYTPGATSLGSGTALPVNAGIGTALTRVGGDLYVAIGQSAQLYRLRSGTWTRLADAPFSFGSGASIAYDGVGSLYALQGGGGSAYARYRIAQNSWGASEAISPDSFRINSGGGLARSGTSLYAVRGNDVSGFASFGTLLPQPLKLSLNNNALLAPQGATTATLFTLNGLEDDYGHTLSGNQFVSGGSGATTWTPSASGITRPAAAFVNENAGVLRTDNGSTLTTGYYLPRGAARPLTVYVSPAYCASCANDSRVWGVDAFASIQAAINSGAQRVLLAPGVYTEAFQLAHGVQVVGAGAEVTIVRPPAGWSGPLVSADGVSQAGLARVTLDGVSRGNVGLRVSAGARGIRFTRSIVRNTATAVVVGGAVGYATTDLELVNVTLAHNARAIDQSGNAEVELRNSIVAYNSDGIRNTQASPRLEYNAYFQNGAASPWSSDVNSAAPSGPGELTQDPLFVNATAGDYRLLSESPAIDAGNPGDPVPPAIGGRTDLGYAEGGRAAFFADDGYGQNALNDGLTWQVDAFATVQGALDAAERYLRGLNCVSATDAREARGICDVRVIVGVGPGSYTEHVRVPSYVRLIGAGAEQTTLNGGNTGSPVTLDGAIRAEVSGFTLLGAPSGLPGVDATNAANGVVIARNIIRANGIGVRASAGARIDVRFNTIYSNTQAGIETAGANTSARIKNNILERNNSAISVADAFSAALSRYNLINSRSLNYGAAPERVQDKSGDITGEAPQFAGEASSNFRLSAASPAVDTASGTDTPVLGGGMLADRGYAELTTVPLVIFLGRSTAPMCTVGNAGVAAVEVGVQAASPSQPISATLPASWQRLTFGTPVTATYWSTSITPAAGLQRLYSLAEDALGNRESPQTRYVDGFGRRLSAPSFNLYNGALIGDGSTPLVALASPAVSASSDAAALVLRATVTGTQDGAFDIAAPFFEVNGARVAAQWVDALGSGPRTFRAVVPMPRGTYAMRAGATDKAGNAGYSSSVTIVINGGAQTSLLPRRLAGSATAHAIGVLAPVSGTWTNQSTLRVNGSVRFLSVNGTGQVSVQAGAGAAVNATLDDATAEFSLWSADMALSEGVNIITATASNADVASSALTQTLVWRDTVSPTLTVPASGSVTTRTVLINGTVSDASSGMAAVDVSVDGGLTWLPATLGSGTYALSWEAPLAEQNTSYAIRVRATDNAGNTRTSSFTVSVDNLAPAGLDPVEFSIPTGSHLDITRTLVMTWTPALDNSNSVTVSAAINQLSGTLPSTVMSGLTLSGDLNADGAWYAHLSAVDRAGNRIDRSYGPWYVGLGNLCYSTQSIALDGDIDLSGNEWRTAEFLDDDERPLLATSGAVTGRERQSLYATWDGDAFYIGWRGAWWDIDGALFAYLDTDAANGTNTPVTPLTPTVALPFNADWAIKVDGAGSGAAAGTLYRWQGGTWVAQPNAEVSHSATGDTEVRIATPILGLGAVRMIAYGAAANAAWSVFPTTNALSGPWTDAYVWGAGGSICDTSAPGSGQTRATSLNVTLDSPQPTHVPNGAGATLSYDVRIENLETFTVTGAALSLQATSGLGYRNSVLPAGASCADCANDAAAWQITLPTLAPGAAITLSVSGALAGDAAALSGVTTVTTTVTTAPAALSGAHALAHPVDAAAPSVTPLPPPAGAVQPGVYTLRGTAADIGGSGLAMVEARRVGDATWQPVSGTVNWSADVTVADGLDNTFEVRARDAVGNVGAVQTVAFVVDPAAPVITFTAPALVGGGQDSLQLGGETRDDVPEQGVVEQVNVQVVDPSQPDGANTTPWIAAFGPLSPTMPGGAQPWHLATSLPELDGEVRIVRASAVDAAGNITTTEWQSMTIDVVAPVISVTDVLSEVTPAHDGGVISGTIEDGMQVLSSTVLIYAPDGAAYTESITLTNDGAFVWQPEQGLITGTYRLRVQSSDLAGNTRVSGPQLLSVVDAPADGVTITVDGAAPAYLGSPLTFTVSAVGTNLSYAWDLGDGAAGSGVSITHTYPAIGAYTVTVTATNSAGASAAQRVVTVVDVPIAGLAAANDSPTRLGSVTTLSATISAGSNVSYTWDLGDGAPAYGDVVTHTYPAGGAYTATVTARNGTSEVATTTAVFSRDFPIDTLSASNDGPTTLGQPTAFSVMQSGGTGVAVAWDFGDGAQSASGPLAAGDAPTHTYGAPGIYTATATLSNTEGVRTTQTIVVVDEAIDGLWIEHDAPTALGDVTHFSATHSAGSSVSYAWDFGDGATATGLEPAHAYAAVGRYTATLTATNSVSQRVTQREVHVHNVAIRQLAGVTDAPNTVGYTTRFTASIGFGTGVSFTWDFGDGVQAAGPLAAHVYTQSGEHSATVTASNETGAISDTVRVTIWPVPAAGFERAHADVDERAGSATFTVTLDVPSSVPVSVDYDWADGAASGGTLTFAPGERHKTITLAVTNDAVHAPDAWLTATLRNPHNAALAAIDELTVRVVNDDPRIFRAHLPLVLRNYAAPVNAPDLIVENARIDASGVTVVISNRGPLTATNAFWVDLYIAPQPLPARVNDVWSDGRSRNGAVWGVTRALAPGERLTLTLSSPYFRADASTLGPIAAGTRYAVQVDSASTLDPVNGAVKETHEIANSAYNNIHIGSAAQAMPAPPALTTLQRSDDPAGSSPLPRRKP